MDKNNDKNQLLFVFQDLFFIRYEYNFNKIDIDFNYYYIENVYSKTEINRDKTNLFFTAIDMKKIKNMLEQTLNYFIVVKKHLKMLKQFCKEVDTFFEDFVSYEKDFLIKVFYKNERKAKNKIRHMFYMDNSKEYILFDNSLKKISLTDDKKINYFFKTFLNVKQIQLKTLNERDKKVLLYELHCLAIKGQIKMELFMLFAKGELTTKKMWELIK